MAAGQRLCVWGDDVGGSWLAAWCLESTKLCGIYCCSWSMPTSNWFYDSPSSQGTSQPITTTNPNNLPRPPPAGLQSRQPRRVSVAERQEKMPHGWELSEKGTIYWSHRWTHTGTWGAYPFSCTHTSGFGFLH